MYSSLQFFYTSLQQLVWQLIDIPNHTTSHDLPLADFNGLTLVHMCANSPHHIVQWGGTSLPCSCMYKIHNTLQVFQHVSAGSKLRGGQVVQVPDRGVSRGRIIMLQQWQSSIDLSSFFLQCSSSQSLSVQKQAVQGIPSYRKKVDSLVRLGRKGTSCCRVCGYTPCLTIWLSVSPPILLNNCTCYPCSTTSYLPTTLHTTRALNNFTCQHPHVQQCCLTSPINNTPQMTPTNASISVHTCTRLTHLYIAKHIIL